MKETPRKRMKTIMNFKEPDKIQWTEKFDLEPVLEWLGTHIPTKEIIKPDSGCVLGIQFLAFQGCSPKDLDKIDINSYFGCPDITGLIAPVDMGPIPRFPTKKIEETEDYYEERVDTGVTTRRSKNSPYPWYTMPMFKDWPVKDRESWREYKKRLNPMNSRRLPKDWDPDFYEKKFKEHENGLTTIVFNGLFGFGAQLMGMDRFMKLFYTDPDFAHEIANFWEFYTTESFRPVLENFGEHVDLAFWWEDMAEKNGPFISPKIYEKFFLPHYTRVSDYFKNNGVDQIMMDSDGNLEPLLDLFVEAGIDGLWPLEVNAGMDARKIREEYEDELWVSGNIDKKKVIQGGKTMKKEVDKKINIAKEYGGYIPGLDHLVPAEMKFERFKEYTEYIKKKLEL